MSSIDKLSILGIRSFGAEATDKAVIHFSSPLTLILGENGCGKTTIIEALKYATSGDLPGNTGAGSGFIHDPKLSSNYETRAQIKLKITNVKGTPMHVSKTMTCTQKIKKLEFKTVDQTVTTVSETGEMIQISSKCVDVNNEMCTALGVSKAILNYVIFCHQEDSNWPLDEGKKIKERFDAIFDTAKYNKCLDHLKKLRKDYLQNLKTMTTQMKFLKDYKESASNKRASLAENETRMSASKDKVQSIKDKIIPLQAKMNEIAQKESNFSQLKTELETLKAKYTTLQNSVQEYKSAIKNEFQGSKDELVSAINSFQDELIEKQKQIDNLERQEERCLMEQKRHLGLISDEQMKFGQLSRDNEKNKERIDTRNLEMVKLSQDLHLSTSLTQLSEVEEIPKALVAIASSIDDERTKMSVIKAEQDAQTAELQEEIDCLREDRAKLQQSVENKKGALAQNRAEARKVKTDIEEVDQSTEKLGLLQTKLDKLKKELLSISESSEKSDIENDLKEAEVEKSRCEDEEAALDREIHILQPFHNIQAELDIKRKAKEAKDNDATKLKDRHEESLLHLLQEIPDQGIKFKLQAIADKLFDEIKSNMSECKQLEHEIASLQSERKHLSEKLRNARQTYISDECSISQACKGKNYESYLTELAAKVQDLQDQKGTLSSSEYMFRRYVQKLQQQEPGCPLCHRKFSAEEEVTELISELTLKVREVPSQLRSNKQQLDLMQEEYKKLLQLKPKYEKLSDLKNVDIPKMEADMEMVDKKLETANQNLARIQAELVAPQSDEALIKSIQGDVYHLEQILSERRQLTREIQKLEAKLPKGDHRSLKEALDDQKKVRVKLQSLRHRIASSQAKRNELISRQQQLQEEKNSIQHQQLKISGNVQMRAQLSDRREELENLEAVIQAEIDNALEEAAAASRKLDHFTRQLKSLVTENDTSMRTFGAKIRELEQKYDSIKRLNEAILDYERSGGSERLSSAQKRLEELETQSDSLQAKKESICTKKDRLKSELALQRVRERELADNLKLCEKLEEEKQTLGKLNAMKLKLGDLDYTNLSKERLKLRQEEDLLIRERAHAEGRQKELENTIRSIKVDLMKDQLKNADKNYREMSIEIEVTKLAAEDLNKYYTAMEWAMLHYHKEKMRHINAIINELWKKVYTGNDIDTIEIKTDIEGSSTSTEKRRSYNYRVVQSKGGVELDMRGRCSAGQKVLACLIIRIALAETFSANCGILALDEPTTNLDTKNIESLNNALAELVNERMLHKNFQLILITHDRNFLEVLSRVNDIDYYFEVKRNSEGKSYIEKVEFEN